MGDTGEQNNKQPAATQRETRWKNKRDITTATQWETQSKKNKKRKKKIGEKRQDSITTPRSDDDDDDV